MKDFAFYASKFFFFSSPEPKAQGELLWSPTVRRCRRCPSVHNLNTTFPPKPLIGFWPNFTGMILGWSSFKVVQMVPVHCISRSQELKIDFLTKKLKKSSCQKPLDWFQYNFAEMFLWWSSTKIVQAIWIRQKTWPPVGGAYFPHISI